MGDSLEPMTEKIERLISLVSDLKAKRFAGSRAESKKFEAIFVSIMNETCDHPDGLAEAFGQALKKRRETGARLEVLTGGGTGVSDERMQQLIYLGETIGLEMKEKGDPYLRSDRDVFIFARAYATGYASGLEGTAEKVPVEELSSPYSEHA